MFGEYILCSKCGVLHDSKHQCDCFRKMAIQVNNEEDKDFYFELSKLLGNYGWGYVNPDRNSILYKLRIVLNEYDEMNNNLKSIRAVLQK